jgi:DNA-directed RNA polymerase subunit D
MKLEILSENDKEIKFVIKDTKISFANMLRRYAISRVETFAIEDVTIYENNTSFFDEFIAHRLGLIPLKMPKGKLKKDYEVLFLLDHSEEGTVYSGHLKSSDKEVVPISDKIPIIKLKNGQNIKLEAKAVLGCAADHAKWQPGIVSYFYEKEDEIKFTIESFGQMKAKEILKRALEKIKEDAEEISKIEEKR